MTVVSLLSDNPTPDEAAKFTILKSATYQSNGKIIRFEDDGWKLFRVKKFGLFQIGEPFHTLDDAQAADGGSFTLEFEDYESEEYGSERVLRTTSQWRKIFAQRPMVRHSEKGTE